MDQCKKCMSRRDCWIKNVNDLRTPMPSEPIEQQIVVKASYGECPCFWEVDYPWSE